MGDIEDWHRKRGFSGIGYHFYITQDGSVHRGRALDEQGAHTKGHNSTSIGICLEGGINNWQEKVPEDNYSDAQWQSLEMVVAYLWNEYEEISEVRGHNYFTDDKECPCFDVDAWAESEGFYL